MRIGVIRISQETDTFNPNLTTKGHFESFAIQHGQAMLDRTGEGIIQCYLQAVDEHGGVTSVPMFKARGGGGGRVETSMYEYLIEELESELLKAALASEGL
jgi:microcystin degradation protein MlrC